MINKIEDWFYRQPVQTKFLYAGFALVFFLIFALNYFFPIYCDDMLYSVVKYGETLNLGENLKEISDFMHMYYFQWGGRVVAHWLLHLLLLFDKLGQDLVNGLVFCVLVYFAYKLSIGENRNNIFVFTFLAVSFFYFTPSFLSSAVWKTGSVNYLWMITITLSFIYPYYKYYNGKEYKDSAWAAILFFLFGVIASCTNENLAPVLFLIITAYLFFVHFYSDKKIPRWAIAGIIGVVAGCSLMILAPGNAVRAASEGYSGLFSSFNRMGDRLPSISASYRYFMLRPILIYLVFIVLFYFYSREGIDRKKVLTQSLIFFLAANISIWLTILAPTFPPRAFMSITVLTIVSIGILYANIDLRKRATRAVNLLFLAVLIFASAIDYMTFLKGTYFLHKQMKIREQKIDEAKAKGETKIEFEAIYMDYRFEYTDYSNFYKDYYNIDVTFKSSN